MSQAAQLHSARPTGSPEPRALRAEPIRRGEPTANLHVDAARWPDVAAVPRARLRGLVARRLLTMAAARLPIRVEPADAPPFGAGGPGAPTMVVHRPRDFYWRVGAAGLIGFGESYMAGDWDCADLTGLLTALCVRVDAIVPRGAQWLRRLYVTRPPADWKADEQGARRNVHQHYDLSNAMFALFLDETMTYSAGLFGEDGATGRNDADGTAAVTLTTAANDHHRLLAAAQRRKIDRILDVTGVGPGTRVLEIGTGWGELALRAAARGASVLSVTVSAEQAALARQRIAAAGVADRVRVELRDYREISGQFDAIVSVEMIEAVSEPYWPDYFRALDRLLAPGGRVGLQAITMPHHRMLATRRTKTWILKYIFPGGLIPSVEAIDAGLRAHTSLRISSQLEFGSDYARTLQIWRQRFAAAARQVRKLGFDEVFQRMWWLYLSYSEAGFAARYLQVSQFLLERQAEGAR